jgi:hypothetical protein
MSSNRPFAVSATLTAIAVGYRNPALSLIADRVLPRVDVTSEKFKYTEFPLAEGFTFPDARVGRRSRPNQLEFSGEEKTDSVDDFGYDVSIPFSDIDEAQKLRASGVSNYDPENRATEGLTDALLLAREVRTAAVIQDTNAYATGRKVALVGTARFNDYANSSPITVIKTGLESTLVHRPNTAVMGQSVWSTLQSHPQLVKAIRGNNTDQGIITREEFCRLFELKDLLVGEGFVNIAKPGQAANLSRVWGKSIQLLFINPAATTQGGITFGFTAQLGAKIAGSWEDRNVGLQGGKTVRVGERVKEKIIAADVGYQIATAIA